MSYPTAEELVEASSVEELTTIDDDGVLDELRVEAIAAVEAYCRQSFAVDGGYAAGSGSGEVGDPIETTRTFDGNGKRSLQLDRRLSELVGVSFNDSEVDAETFALGVHKNRLVFAETSLGSWASRAVAEMEFDGALDGFIEGFENIAVTGIWGWTPAEYEAECEAVTRAMRLDMEDHARIRASRLAATAGVARGLGLGSISQGNLSMDLSAREPGISRRVERALAGKTPSGEYYRWPVGLPGVV